MSRALVLFLLSVAITFGACGDEAAATYRGAAEVVLTPADGLDLPLRTSGGHWLLRDQSGWCGAHVAQYGGEEGDPAVATVRAAVFRTYNGASRAFNRLSPDYLRRTLELRVAATPWPITYPHSIPGDRTAVMAYQVRLPPGYDRDTYVEGQFTVVQIGRVVLLVESIGVAPEQFVPAVERWVAAADALPSAGC